MCACGCFILAALVAAIVYGVMHGLWLLFAAALHAAHALRIRAGGQEEHA